MGTYLYAQLKDTSENNIKKVNAMLKKRGFPTEYYNGVEYGAFVTREQLQEDARFMNETPEGLKQAPHWQRPVKVEDLEHLFWNKIGQACYKLSGGHDDSVALAMIVAKFLATHRNLFDLKECSNHDVAKVRSYIYEQETHQKLLEEFKQKNS